ncbi:unnamed protein product [Brugia pahangi]|uniref:Uncharacterized protein n=1 Tax=Brugia pahangi TaxID=6280 RepID=A0A0N4TYV4_BRUPA|nr:unnamed protein product [Brugia pahangi]
MMDVSDNRATNLLTPSQSATHKQCLQQQQTVDQLAVSAAVATAQQQQQMGDAVGCGDDPSP